MSNYVSNYISNLYNLYKSANDKKQSLSEILESFSQISKNYKETSEIKNQENNYSSNNFLSCTDIEQQNIINNQLNNIKCLVTNSIYEKQGIIWKWTDIFKLITDETYNNTEKINRLGQSGSTIVNLNKAQFGLMEALVPSISDMNDFDTIVKPLFEQILANQYENQRLAVLRDTLLPKLMNGEIDVSSVKI